MATKTELRPIFWNLRLLKGWDKWIKIFCKIAKLHEIYAINLDIFSRAQIKSYFSKSNLKKQIFFYVLMLSFKRWNCFSKLDFFRNSIYVIYFTGVSFSLSVSYYCQLSHLWRQYFTFSSQIVSTPLCFEFLNN